MKTYLLGLLTLVFAFAGVAGRAAAQTDYLIGPQDVLTITVFGEAGPVREIHRRTGRHLHVSADRPR